MSVYSAGGSQLTQVPVSVGTGLTFTYVHWVKLTALPSAFQGTYIASATDAGVGHGLLGVGLSTASGWECAIGQATTNAGCAATPDRAGGWVTGEWVCLAVTFAPSLGARMYVGYLNQPMQEVTYQAGHAGGGLGSGNVNVPAGSPQLYWGSFLSAGAASIPAHHHTFGYWTRVLDLREMRQFQAGIVPPGAYAVVAPRGTEPAPVDLSGNKRAVSYVSGATIRQGESFPRPIEAIADDEWTSTASGIVALSAPASRHGSASLTVPAPTTAATGTLALAGASALTLPAPTTTANGKLALAGAASLTVPAPTTSAAGALAVVGASALTVPAPTTTAAGALALQGAVALSLAAPTVSGASAVALTASAALTIPAPTIAATGAVALTGASALTVPTPTVTATGGSGASGIVALTLPTPTTAAGGTLAVTGSASLTLAAATFAAASALALQASATLAVGIPALGGAGALALTGAAGLTLPPVGVSATGTLTVIGGAVAPGTFGPLVAAAARRLGAGVPAATRALGPPTPTAARAFGPPVVSHES